MYTISKFEMLRRKVARTTAAITEVATGTSRQGRRDVMVRVTSGRFRPEIDGLRFFAIIPVVLSHLFEWMFRRQSEMGFPVSSNYHQVVNHLPGVLLFFAISGYILTYQIRNASEGGYSWSKYANYILRRFKRIAPPYYILLAATLVIVGILGFRPSGGGRHFDASEVSLVPSFIASLLYSHWLIYQEWPRLFGAGWTLEIETQYYVMAPVLTLIYLNLRNKNQKIALGIAMILLSSVVACQYKVGTFWAGTIIKFFPYFFTGMLALELQEDFKGIEKTVPRLAADAIAATAVFFYMCLRAPEDGAGIAMFEYLSINIVCIMMMFIAVSIDGNVLRWICTNRYVVIIGGACYSIYLTHGQIVYLLQGLLYKHIVVANTALAMLLNVAFEVPVAVAVGLAFYLVIERPFMMWGRTRRREHTILRESASNVP